MAALLVLSNRQAESQCCAGVTFVHDVGPAPTDIEAAWQNLEDVYLKAADDSQLALRVLAMVPLFSWRVHGLDHIMCCADSLMHANRLGVPEQQDLACMQQLILAMTSCLRSIVMLGKLIAASCTCGSAGIARSQPTLHACVDRHADAPAGALLAVQASHRLCLAADMQKVCRLQGEAARLCQAARYQPRQPASLLGLPQRICRRHCGRPYRSHARALPQRAHQGLGPHWL